MKADEVYAKLIKIAGNANGVIDDTNVSNKTTYSSDKIVKEIDNLICDVVTENLNGKKLIPKTQSEYDALSDSEKNKEDIIYLITDYAGGGSSQPQKPTPTLGSRLKLLIKKSIDSSTGEVVDDIKKACTDNFIEVTPDSILEFYYNEIWGVARGFSEDKSFVATINVINEYDKPGFIPTGIHKKGKYEIPANVKYIKIILCLDNYASTEISNATVVTGYDILIGDKIYHTVGY